MGEYLNHTGDLDKAVAQAVELIRGGGQVAAHVWSGSVFLAEVTTDHNGNPTVERQAGGDPQVWVECRAVALILDTAEGLREVVTAAVGSAPA